MVGKAPKFLSASAPAATRGEQVGTPLVEHVDRNETTRATIASLVVLILLAMGKPLFGRGIAPTRQKTTGRQWSSFALKKLTLRLPKTHTKTHTKTAKNVKV